DEDRRARVHHRCGEAVLLRRGVEAMPSQPRRRERSSKPALGAAYLMPLLLSSNNWRCYSWRSRRSLILAITAATMRSQRAPANSNVSRTAAPTRALMWLRISARARCRRAFAVSWLISDLKTDR